MNRATRTLGAAGGKRSEIGHPSTGAITATRGSTLVEVVLGLVIVVLAVWLATDVLGGIQHRRRRDQFVIELRNLASVFQKQGEALTAAAEEGPLPPAVVEALKPTNWSKGSPFGGNYEWSPSRPAATAPGSDAAPRIYGAITLTAFAPVPPLTLTRADLLYLDAALDDGNLATGRFRTGFNGWPQYFVGPER